MRRSKLSARTIKTVSTRGRYADGGNLFLQVSKSGTKSWLFRYMRNGRARAMGLGSADGVTLAQAREKAATCRTQLQQGDDPIEVRKSGRVAAQRAAARAITFRQCAEACIKTHEASWRNAKHREQWDTSFRLHVYPRLSNMAVGEIDTSLVIQVLEPIWMKIPQTASRIRGRIERVLNWAKARGFRNGENPAVWRGHLDQLLPPVHKIAPVQHHPAMPYSVLPEFMTKLRENPGVVARCIEFLVLTASRSGEARCAKWGEINLASKMWIVPAERMKSFRKHRVPLSDQVVDLLKTLPQVADNPHLFPGELAEQPLSDRSLALALRRLGYSVETVHGFRSTFRDWAAEQTNYPREVAEASLAHINADKTEAAYRRTDLFERRRHLMEEWATYCFRPAIKSAEVVPLRQSMNG